jgi:hypothetical protein
MKAIQTSCYHAGLKGYNNIVIINIETICLGGDQENELERT